MSGEPRAAGLPDALRNADPQWSVNVVGLCHACIHCADVLTCQAPDFVYRYRNLPPATTVGQLVELAVTYGHSFR